MTLISAKAQYVVVNTWPDHSTFYIMIPRDLLMFAAESGSADYKLSIHLINSQKKTVFQKVLSFTINDWEIQPGELLIIDTDLEAEPGRYKLVTLLRNEKLGDKKENQLIVDVPERTDNRVQPLIIAKRGSRKILVQNYQSLNRDLGQCFLVINTYCLCDSIQILADLDNNPVRRIIPRNMGMEIDIRSLWGLGYISYIELCFFYGMSKTCTGDLLKQKQTWQKQRYGLEDQLLQIKYIASQNEWKTIRAMAKDDQLNAIEYFWLKHDNTPGTSRNEFREYFNERVLKADELFTIHEKMPGWKSDRGRIYIIHGPPDEISEDVFPMGRFPSITWYYYDENGFFYFIDRSGYGNYKLVSMNEED